MKYEIKKKIIKPLCIYSLAFSMLLPSLASLADLDINLGGYGVVEAKSNLKKLNPTINKAFAGDEVVSGGKLVGYGQRNKIGKKCSIILEVRSIEDYFIKQYEFEIQPNERGTTWSIKLNNPLKVGDKLKAFQQFNGNTSEIVRSEVTKGLRDTYKDALKMPEGEIWIEQYVANIVSTDEKAEALALLKEANPEIAEDIKSVEFKITGEDPN